MFNQLGMGQLVVTETAWYARQILARWPAALVEHPFPPEARIEAFLDGPIVDPADGDVARVVINRALTSADHVEAHPELDNLDGDNLIAVWLAVVFWFGIKSGSTCTSETGANSPSGNPTGEGPELVRSGPAPPGIIGPGFHWPRAAGSWQLALSYAQAIATNVIGHPADFPAVVELAETVMRLYSTSRQAICRR